jgi:hypothetical protein
VTNLLILNGCRFPGDVHRPPDHASYRGTDRKHPSYCDAQPPDHEINELFMWFLEEGGELGLVHNFSKACRYCELCNLHFAGEHFEVVEVTDGETSATMGGPFLGFDLSAGYNSSLLWRALGVPSNLSMVSKEIAILTEVINRLFVPQLNQHLLLQSFEDASLCRQAMIALQSFRPGLYEGGDLDEFKIVGVYLIAP